MRETEQGNCAVIANLAVVASGHELIEKRKRVTNRTATRAHYQRDDTGFNRDIFFFTERLEIFVHLRRWHQPERIVMSARTNSRNNFVWLGRREDELHVGRRLFDNLE